MLVIANNPKSFLFQEFEEKLGVFHFGVSGWTPIVLDAMNEGSLLG